MKKKWKTRPIRIRGDIAFIPLTRGKTAIIDAADVALVKDWNWCAMPAESGLWYAYNGGLNQVRLHQMLLPAPAGFITDHIDRNGLNCRRKNLRFATSLQNSHNRKRIGFSGFKGVHSRGSGWRARITIKGKRISLGQFSSVVEAARAYDVAAKKHFGSYAFLNFPAVGS